LFKNGSLRFFEKSKFSCRQNVLDDPPLEIHLTVLWLEELLKELRRGAGGVSIREDEVCEVFMVWAGGEGL
jgi:hypothetical protein